MTSLIDAARRVIEAREHCIITDVALGCRPYHPAIQGVEMDGKRGPDWTCELDDAISELKKIATGFPPTTTAIPMLLRCPSCGKRHVDKGEFATKLHHTHACQHCGEVWRPAIVATVGVQFLPGFKNDPA